MKTVLPDGRVFETQPFLTIETDDTEPVYIYTFTTNDRTVKSSAGHEWGVWNKKTKSLEMVKMQYISKEDHELLIQGWEDVDTI